MQKGLNIVELENKIGKNLLHLVTNNFSFSKFFKMPNILILLIDIFHYYFKEILFKIKLINNTEKYNMHMKTMLKNLL